MRHELKIYPRFFNAVDDGSKTFELRRNDRNFKVFDTIQLREFNPDGGGYTGRTVDVLITYILAHLAEGMAPGYCILSIKKVDDETPRIDKADA